MHSAKRAVEPTSPLKNSAPGVASGARVNPEPQSEPYRDSVGICPMDGGVRAYHK